MKLETILVPYDGSEQAKRALEYAKDLAAIAGGACCVRAVHVMPSDLINEKDLDGSSLEGVPLGLLGREEYQGLLNKVVDRARERVKEGLQDVIDEMGDSLVVDVIADPSAVDALVYYAKKHDADLIVTGSPRPGRFARYARQRELRRAARGRHSGAHGEIALVEKRI